MRIAIRSLIGLLVVIAIVVGIGYAQPREHTATSAIELPEGPDTVWAVVRDLAALEGTWPALSRVQRLPDRDGAELWEQVVNGNPLRVVVRRDDAPRILVTTIDANRDDPFGGTWTYQIEARPEGVEVRVTEAGWVSNPVFRFVMLVMGTHRTMDGYLTALGRHFGHEVSPRHVE